MPAPRDDDRLQSHRLVSLRARFQDAIERIVTLSEWKSEIDADSAAAAAERQFD